LVACGLNQLSNLLIALHYFLSKSLPSSSESFVAFVVSFLLSIPVGSSIASSSEVEIVVLLFFYSP
jgi:hypothetical protein